MHILILQVSVSALCIKMPFQMAFTFQLTNKNYYAKLLIIISDVNLNVSKIFKCLWSSMHVGSGGNGGQKFESNHL